MNDKDYWLTRRERMDFAVERALLILLYLLTGMLGIVLFGLLASLFATPTQC